MRAVDHRLREDDDRRGRALDGWVGTGHRQPARDIVNDPAVVVGAEQVLVGCQHARSFCGKVFGHESGVVPDDHLGSGSTLDDPGRYRGCNATNGVEREFIGDDGTPPGSPKLDHPLRIYTEREEILQKRRGVRAQVRGATCDRPQCIIFCK